MAQPAVLFDVDGTLVDSNFHHVVAWHHAFLDVGMEVPCWRILGLIGRSGSDLVRLLLGDDLANAHASHVEKLHTKYFVDSAPLVGASPVRENCSRPSRSEAGERCSPRQPVRKSWRCCGARSTPTTSSAP